VAITQRAIKIEREENVTALCIDIIRAVEVLAELLDTSEDQDRLFQILQAVASLKSEAIDRRYQR
jgi:regulator of RNase E activity RraB